MKTNSIMILLALLLIAVCAHAQADVPANVRVLSCVNGSGSTYAVVTPGAAVSMNVSANASGTPSLCGVPTSFPLAYYVKTTTDFGKTWQWTYHLADFGFQTTTGTTPPVTTPPVTTPATCPDTFVPVNWTCSAANGVATCTAPLQ